MTRIKLGVYVDTDRMLSAPETLEAAREAARWNVSEILKDAFPHYNPEVVIESDEPDEPEKIKARVTATWQHFGDDARGFIKYRFGRARDEGKIFDYTSMIEPSAGELSYVSFTVDLMITPLERLWLLEGHTTDSVVLTLLNSIVSDTDVEIVKIEKI